MRKCCPTASASRAYVTSRWVSSLPPHGFCLPPATSRAHHTRTTPKRDGMLQQRRPHTTVIKGKKSFQLQRVKSDPARYSWGRYNFRVVVNPPIIKCAPESDDLHPLRIVPCLSCLAPLHTQGYIFLRADYSHVHPRTIRTKDFGEVPPSARRDNSSNQD